MARPTPGRPPLPEGAARTVIVRTRLNAREFSVVQAQATRRGISVAAYLRRLADDHYDWTYFRMLGPHDAPPDQPRGA